MEAQYFESDPKNDNIILKILMVIGIIFLLVLTFYAFVGIQKTSKETKYIGTNNNLQDTINISETGTVYAAPDTAEVTFTTITQNNNIAQALTNNANATNSILDFLKRQGVADADMQTVDFNVYPQYQWQTKGLDLTVYPLGKRVIINYQATQSVTVKIRNNDQIGNVIQGAVTAGASQVSDLTFIVGKEDDYKQQARDLAVAQAKTKAEAIAKSLGVKLGNVVSYTESYYTPIYTTKAVTTGTGSNLQISVGENKIQSTVNISYEIK